MLRIRSLLAVLMIVLSLGLHVEGPHGHHCILEEAACVACRTAVTPADSAPPAIDAVTVTLQPETVSAPQPGPAQGLRCVLTDAPLRAPPCPNECA